MVVMVADGGAMKPRDYEQAHRWIVADVATGVVFVDPYSVI